MAPTVFSTDVAWGLSLSYSVFCGVHMVMPYEFVRKNRPVLNVVHVVWLAIVWSYCGAHLIERIG